MKLSSPSFYCAAVLMSFLALVQHVEAKFTGSLSREVLNSWLAKEPHSKTLNLTSRQISQLADGVFLNNSMHAVGFLSVDLSFNQLKTLKANRFGGLSAATSLNLSHNQLQWLDPQAFRGLFSLDAIDLSHNQLTTQSDQSFKNLPYLTKMDLSYNLFKSAPVVRFQYSLKMNLSHNQIERVDGRVFDRVFAKYSSIDFSHNRIKYIDYERLNANCMQVTIKGNPIEANFTTQTRNLVCVVLYVVGYRDSSAMPMVNLSTNKLVEWNLYENRSRTRLLDLGARMIENIDGEVLTGYDRLNYLHLENNSIREIRKENFHSLRYSLLELYLDDNKINYISANVFQGLEKLQVLSLAGNEIATFSFDGFAGLAGLIWLFLNSNRFPYVHGAYFKKMDALRYLDLSDNRISFLDDNDFEDLTSLIYLNLSENFLRRTAGSQFIANKGLVKLDLSKNRINVLHSPDGFNQLCLQELSLEDNDLANFSWKYDEIKRCVVVKNLSGLPLEILETSTPIQTEEPKEHSHDVDYIEIRIPPPKMAKTSVSPALIIFLVAVSCGLVFFVVFVVSHKLRGQRAARS